MDRGHSCPSSDESGPWHRQSNSCEHAPCAYCQMDKGTSQGSRTSACCGQSRPQTLQHRPKPSASESLLLARRIPFPFSQRASQGVLRLPAEAVDRARARLAGYVWRAFEPHTPTRRPRFEACPETVAPPHLCESYRCERTC